MLQGPVGLHFYSRNATICPESDKKNYSLNWSTCCPLRQKFRADEVFHYFTFASGVLYTVFAKFWQQLIASLAKSFSNLPIDETTDRKYTGCAGWLVFSDQPGFCHLDIRGFWFLLDEILHHLILIFLRRLWAWKCLLIEFFWSVLFQQTLFSSFLPHSTDCLLQICQPLSLLRRLSGLQKSKSSLFFTEYYEKSFPWL